MQQSVLTWNHFNESSVRHNALHLAFILRSNLYGWRECNGSNSSQRRVNCCFIRRCNFNDALSINIFDANVGFCFCLNLLNDLTTWANDWTDGFTWNFQCDNTRRMVLVICTWLSEVGQHLTTNVMTSFARLHQSFTQLSEAQPFDLDVHLTRCDAVFSTRYLEVHIT